MNGKLYEDLDFELNVSLFEIQQHRGANLTRNSTTALFSKKFNNLFVKNFPKANFSEDDLKVSSEGD